MSEDPRVGEAFWFPALLRDSDGLVVADLVPDDVTVTCQLNDNAAETLDDLVDGTTWKQSLPGSYQFLYTPSEAGDFAYRVELKSDASVAYDGWFKVAEAARGIGDVGGVTGSVTGIQCIAFSQVTEAMIDLPDGVDLEDYVQEVLDRQKARLLRRIGQALFNSTDAGIQADIQQAELLYVRADLRRSYATKLVSYQFEPLPGDFRTPDPSEMRKLADADDKAAEGVLVPIVTSAPSNFLGAIAGGGIDDTAIQPGILGLNY